MFEERKERALARLRAEEGKKGRVDEEVVEIIGRLNSLKDFFTTSSCSGRIVLLRVPEVGAKREAVFLGKWHRAVTKEEVLAVLKRSAVGTAEKGEVWLLSQSPILHVACRTLGKAKALLAAANESGFKYSGIKTISNSNDNGKVVVEIVSTERIDVPLAEGGVLFCSDPHLDFIVSKANFTLARGKAKLKRFYSELKMLE